MKHKLSVITICYNIKDEIERTCLSIVSQSNQNFEWIVIDGGSTDGTVDILNKYKDKMSVFISEQDKGIYNAMNKGIKQATGEFLNFMNGGDEFADITIVDDFLKYDTTDTDILYGNMKIVENNGLERLQTYPSSIDKLFFCKNVIGHQAAFIRRELFEKYGLYNEQYRIIGDWEKWIVFSENMCRYKYINRTIATFHHNGISAKMSKKHVVERNEILKAHFSKDEIDQAEKDAYNWKSILFFNLIPLLTVKEKKNGNQWAIYLFKRIPLYKIHKKYGHKKHYLFGVIPFIGIKEK